MTSSTYPNRTQIPNIVDDLGLDPYERALYVHYKRVCGENQGAYCYEATKTTAQKVKMSTGQVSEARKILAGRGLILVQEGRPIIVTVVNIWELNTAYYQLENRPDIDGWTVEQVKQWVADVHTVNLHSHNDSNLYTRSEPNLTINNDDVHTVNEHSHGERNLTEDNNMSSDVHTVKQRIETLNPIESIIDNPITSNSNELEGGKPPPTPVKIPEPIPKVEYTEFEYSFLTYFSAKRFKNPTQHKTIAGLIALHGETEIDNLAQWAAKRGMGLGQAIPAIESALKNPKRKDRQNGAYQNGQHKSTKQPTEKPDLTNPDTWAAQLEAASGKRTS